tara:strand:+ start:2731 stop:3384 length:654 start_codon:yes stop_codon:yes gene_type:complete
MRKLLLLIIFTLAYSIHSKSQTRIGLGVHLGIAKVGVYNDDASYYQKNANGLQIGFGYNLKIGPVGFSPEINVVNFKFNYNEDSSRLDNSRYYFSLPLLFKWYLGPLNLHAGPQFSYLVGGRWDANNTNECVLDQCIELEKDGKTEEIDIYRKHDVSAIIGLGLDTKIGLYASLRAAISLLPIASEGLLDYYGENDGFNDIGEGKYLSSQLFIGYRF